ncbi:hypothetical protein L484_012874 [Morus notabilis]|uniref:Uncharacterized protein n=1 Tax=Morus notabilis TaxID=981085 RepID=W9RNH2_9ROSA|nr:hypothetical protein L484_012874 [Morus notabilis]
MHRWKTVAGGLFSGDSGSDCHDSGHEGGQELKTADRRKIRGGGQDRRRLVGREEEDLASVVEEEIVQRRRKSWAEMGSGLLVVAVGQPEVLVAVGGSHLRRRKRWRTVGQDGGGQSEKMVAGVSFVEVKLQWQWLKTENREISPPLVSLILLCEFFFESSILSPPHRSKRGSPAPFTGLSLRSSGALPVGLSELVWFLLRPIVRLPVSHLLLRLPGQNQILPLVVTLMAKVFLLLPSRE